MLTARYNNETIYINDFKSHVLKQLSDQKELTCPDCGDPIIFKYYESKQSHFSHHQSDCSFPFREPESIEHERGKNELYYWLSTLFKKNDVRLEEKVDATNQRADTFVLSKNMAIEFQCSPIQAKTWNKRNELYKEANVTDFWILGYSMHKYHNDHPYTHKLNQLEESIINNFGKIVYFDVLTKQFVLLYPEYKKQKILTAKEYYFKPSELFIENKQILSKYEYFINMQKKREQFAHYTSKKALETDSYLKKIKKDVQANKILATKKQINYIKYLLYQHGKTIPYKLHGLLKEEADILIKKLKENENKTPS